MKRRLVWGIAVVCLVLAIVGCSPSSQASLSNDDSSLSGVDVVPKVLQYTWSYDMTITTYYNDIQLTSTTYCVYDSPTKKEIYLPKNLFNDGAQRVLIVKDGEQPKLLNTTNQKYESVPQGMENLTYQANQSDVFTSFKSTAKSEGFELKKVIDDTHELYVKTQNNMRYEVTLNTMKDVPEKINMYQEDYRKDVPVLTERIQTEMVKGCNLPKKIMIEQRPVNTQVSDVILNTVVEYTTKKFEPIVRSRWW